MSVVPHPETHPVHLGCKANFSYKLVNSLKMAEGESNIVSSGLDEHASSEENPVSQSCNTFSQVPSEPNAVAQSAEIQPVSRSYDIACQVPSKLNDVTTNAEIQPVSQSCNILVTGVTGCGKSALIAGLSGETTSSGYHSVLGGVNTTEVLPISCDFGEGFTATLWDTPGLLDGSKNPRENLKQIAKKCRQRTYIIHCLKVIDCRLISGKDHPGMLSIRILTKHFKKSFWRHAIFALTFANCVEEYRPLWRDLTDEEKRQEFNKEIEQWESFIKDNLIKYARIPDDIVNTIAVIPVGHNASDSLLDGQNWIEKLKSLCCDRLKLLCGNQLTSPCGEQHSESVSDEGGSQSHVFKWLSGLFCCCRQQVDLEADDTDVQVDLEADDTDVQVDLEADVQVDLEADVQVDLEADDTDVQVDHDTEF